MTTPTTRRVLARLTDPRSVVHGAASTAAVAALSLVDPRRLGPGARLAYRAAEAALAAWVTWSAFDDPELRHLPRGTRLSAAMTAAGVTMGLADASEAVDARMTSRMERAGVAQPRLVIAAASTLLSAGVWWLGRRGAEPAADVVEVLDELGDELDPAPLPDAVRAIAAALLGATDGFGASELRAQLDSAQAVVYEGAGGRDAFWPGIGFRVDPELPRAVPGNGTFPVIGRFRALEGRTFDAYLVIADGRLDTLAISEGADWTPDDMEAWFTDDRSTEELGAWPDAASLELLAETPQGLARVEH